MSIQRTSINDYPEHLNPFYEGDQKLRFWKNGKVKRSSSFGESLRNTLLLKSFRKKKKEKDVPNYPVELRKNGLGVQPVQRQTLPTIYSPSSIRTSTPVPLPRSRFSERVPKPPSIQVTENATNPFDEKEEEKVVNKYTKKRKRKAPLPPNLTGSSQNVSNWSLTSDGTDMSTCSDSEITTDPDVSACIANITKEIERMTENDGDNLNNTKATCHEQSSNIPDLVVSSIDGTQIEKSQIKVVESSTDENFNVVSDISIQETTGPDIVYHTNCNEKDTVDIGDEHKNIHKVDSLTNLINSIDTDNNEKFGIKEKLDVINNSIDECDNHTETEITNNAKEEESNANCGIVNKRTYSESALVTEDSDKKCLSSSHSTENVHKTDSLMNLINSIDDSQDLVENEFGLKEVDSLTNIINSINFTDNEAFEEKDSTQNCSVELNEIAHCDTIKVEVEHNDEVDIDRKPHLKEGLENVSVRKIIENNFQA